MLAAPLFLLLTLIPAGTLYTPAKNAQADAVFCDHPAPYVYCAVKARGRFPFALDRPRLEVFSPAEPANATLGYRYSVQPIVQWKATTDGEEFCLRATVVRQDLEAVSASVEQCTRATAASRMQLLAMPELAVAADGPVLLSLEQRVPTEPIEIIGVHLYVATAY